MDIVSYILSTTFTKKSLVGMGALKGAPAMISGISDNPDGTHNITFSWKDNNNVTHTSVLTVKDGQTPSIASVPIANGHRVTFATTNPSQSVTFDVMNGNNGQQGISVVGSNVDTYNHLTFTLSNGNTIDAGYINAVTQVDNVLSSVSTNPVENKVITAALDTKVDKEAGKGLFSDEEKAKLANIEDGAQVNVLEKLIINGQEATITDKSIALTLITSAVSNLQNYYLKTETYTKQEVEDLIGSTVGVTIEIVEQLPTEGQSNVIYFLPTETEGVYSQYIYSNNSWILIGSTTVDLSNYYTKAQVDTLLNGKQNVLTIDSFPTALSNNPVASGGVYTAIAQMQPQFQFANMPTASASNLGFVYQYTGVTGTYTQNMFYRCIYDDTLGEYKWEEVIFHATVTVDSAISGTSTNPVQNKVIKEALDTKQDIMQYSTMPSAQDNLGKIVQYIGTNTANYTNGYFYKAIYDSTSDVYVWSVIKFSADMLVDNALSTTSENPVQNKVITGAINNIQGVIPNEASSTNQLVDRDSLGTASQKNFTPYVSPDNTDVPISSSVYSAITSAVYGAYHPSGSKTIAELTSDLLILANIGNVYKITEDGVTTNLFIGGAGQTIHTGDNAVVVYGGQPNTFLFDLQSGSIDLTPYQTKTLGSAVEGKTTVEGALGALSTDKQSKDLTTAVEGATTVEGALGALSANKQDSLTFDNVPTENSNNPVKSGGVYADEKTIYEVMGQNSAKNFIPFDLDKIKAKNTTGTWNGNVYSLNGIDFTFNSDGTVDASGTATETASVHYYDPAGLPPFGGDRILRLTGCPSGGGTGTTYKVMAYRAGAVDGSTGTAEDYGDGISLRWLNDGSGVKAFISISVYTGAGTIDLTFKPMLRLASDSDSTYQPYAKTNQQLTADTTALLDNMMENGAVNYLNVNLADIKANNSGSWVIVDNTFTINGITFTINTDGTILVNGTASASSQLSLMKNVDFGSPGLVTTNVGVNDNGSYKIQGTPSEYYNNDNLRLQYSTSSHQAVLYVKNGASLNNVKVYPMIVKSSILLTGDIVNDYVPYAKTNRELTEKIDIIGNLFTTTTKVVDNITHGIATTVATLGNLPIGTYVVSGQFNSDSAMSGGGLVQFASSGVIQNGASCNPIINQGFKANAGLTGIFNVTNATNQINLQIYTATADLPVSSARLAAIRIA